MQINLGCVWEKRAAIVRCCLFTLCAVSLYHRLWGLLFYNMDMESLTCAHWVREIHTKGGQAKTSHYNIWTRRDWRTVLHPAPPGDQTQGVQISFLTQTTELHPQWELWANWSWIILPVVQHTTPRCGCCQPEPPLPRSEERVQL